MKKKKILFLDHSPFAGGAQLCLASHIKYLDRRNFDPFLIIARDSKIEHLYKESNVPILKIDFEALKRPTPQVLIRLCKSVFQFRQVVKKLQPDIVMANTTRALIIGALGKKNYTLISYIRDQDYSRHLLRILGPRVDKFLMVSKFLNDYYQIKKTKPEVVYLGSDIKNKLEKVTALDVKKFRAGFGLKEDNLAIGYVGRLVAGKGPQILLQAIAKITDPKVKLLFFGSGKGQAEDIEALLLQKMKNEKISSRVKMAGFFSNQALIYKSLDIFVLPTCKSEAFSTSVIEAAFAGLPIIATHIGGTPEFIKDNHNGLLVKPGDSSALTQALVKLIQDKKLARKLGSQAYRDAQEFTEDKLAAKLEKIYEQSFAA